jgi:ubiquinone/menaquinone biosynthesis C-methylase UbiE
MAKGSHFKDPKVILEQGYDRVADHYPRLEDGDRWPRTRRLEKLLHALPPGSSVRDLGCGSGDPAGILMAQQHHATGVDLSREQIKRARRNVSSGTLLHADAASVQFPHASFDAVVSSYTLEHIPRAEHASLFAPSTAGSELAA